MLPTAFPTYPQIAGMQPYRPPHLRQQGGSTSSTSSASAVPLPSGSSLPARPLDASSSSFVPRQHAPPRSSPTTSNIPSSRPRNAWTPGRGGGNLASPSGDIRPMRSDHHAAPQPQRASSSTLRSGHANGSSPARLGARNGVELDMEMLQSVSRSGGDGAEGDALKDWNVQEQYRQYIDTRLEKHYSSFPTPRNHAPAPSATEELESLTSIVLLFRKLREGVVASHRIDAFAIEVFESSAKVAILANHRAQALASLSGLVPGLYRMYEQASTAHQATSSDVGGTTSSDGLDEALQSLSIDSGTPNGHDKNEDRIHFASLLLLYHLVLSAPAVFQKIYQDLTLLHRPTLPSRPTDTSPSAGAEPPFVFPEQLDTVRRAREALSPDLFDPLKYWNLIRDSRTTPYERAILAWAGERVRERSWEMMKKVYLELGMARAAQMLGLPDEEVHTYAEKKGARVDNGRLKLR